MVTKPDAVAASITLTAASPLAGDYAVILIAAVLGASVALSKMEPGTHRRKYDGAKYVFRSVAIAFSMTWVAAVGLSRVIGFEVAQLLFPVAFVIAWLGDDGMIFLKDLILARIAKK